jgi:hypothetical protein
VFIRSFDGLAVVKRAGAAETESPRASDVLYRILDRITCNTAGGCWVLSNSPGRGYYLLESRSSSERADRESQTSHPRGASNYVRVE